jgi:hypothetical protein
VDAHRRIDSGDRRDAVRSAVGPVFVSEKNQRLRHRGSVAIPVVAEALPAALGARLEEAGDRQLAKTPRPIWLEVLARLLGLTEVSRWLEQIAKLISSTGLAIPFRFVPRPRHRPAILQVGSSFKF